MDPFTFIAICVVAFGVVGGFDAASGGLVRAEVGGGVRGAGRALGGAGLGRWRQSRKAAREIRMQSPLGRIVQGYLDAFGGAVRVAVRGWRSGRVRAKQARQERMAGEPWPLVRVCGPLVDRVKRWADERPRSGSGHPNGVPNGADPNDPNGDPNRLCSWTVSWPALAVFGYQKPCRRLATVGPLCAEHDAESRSTPCIQCGSLMGSNPDCGECQALRIARGEVGPYGPPVAEPNDPNAEAAFGPDEGCLEVVGWPEDEAEDRIRCGEPCEPGWRICPTHKAERLADPDYPNEDIDEFRDPNDPEWRERLVPNPDPNGDPNVPHDSHLPDANGDVKCGCCAQLHKPTPPGQHCPACHIHTEEHWTAPLQHVATINPRGTSMDINTAPAAIAAWEAFGSRWESLQSRADAIQGDLDSLKNEADALDGEIATLADGMGDFAIGGEGDVSGAMSEVAHSLTSAKEQADAAATGFASAKERTDAYVDNLHLEYDASIEAAAGKAADAHAVMQEA